MQEKRTIQKHFALLTRFAVVCGVVIAMTCAGPAGLAQENQEHHHHNKIYTGYVNGSASKALLDLLSRDYSIIPMDKITPPFKLYPILIGPAALANPDITAFLVRAYRAGLTVGIAYCDAAMRQTGLMRLVEGELAASCLPAPGAPRIALYAVQRTTREYPEEVSRYCLPTVFQAGSRTDESGTDESDQGWTEGQSRNQSGETEEQWLSAAFAPQAPPPPLQSVDIANDSSVNLDSLSRKTHCSEFYENQSGQVQDDYFVTSMRNFDSQRDYYYVQDFPQIKSYRVWNSFSSGGTTPFVKRYPDSDRERVLTGTRILFSEPATTTQFVSEYTNARSTTVSASVGYSGGFPEVSTSVSVTVGNSTTVTVPPVTIRNQSNLGSGTTRWDFHPANPRLNVLYSTAESWIWFIDRDVYGDRPNEISEVFSHLNSGTGFTTISGVCGFPPPFPTFEVGAPQITSVDPEAVQRGGGTFLIRGARMYPGILRNVLLGGDALPPANFVPINDTEIRVVVPSSQNTGPNPIQVNTSFNGSVLPSNY